MKIGFSKNNSFFWVFTDGVWKAHRALQSETQRQRKAMDLWSKAGVRHHTKQLQGAIINFLFVSIPRPTTELIVSTHICESCQGCVWRYSASIFYRYPNNHTNDCLGWIWAEFLDQYEKYISSWKLPALPVQYPGVIMGSPLNRGLWCANKCTWWLLN